MNLEFMHALGLCRRAGKISWGHDAALAAVLSGKAKLCILCSDASQRLKNEFIRVVQGDEREVKVIFPEAVMDDMKTAIGVRAGVITINDSGLMQMLIRKYENNIGEESANGH